MKLLPIRKTAKTNLINSKINTFKIRFLALASIVLIAVSGAVAFSSTSAASSIHNLLFSEQPLNLSGASDATSIFPKFALSLTPEPVAAFVTQSGDAPATVTTDRTDYNPGETVVITGSGFAVYENVSLEIKREGVVAATYQATADQFGNIINREFVIGANDIGASFVLKATGSTSGKIANSRFTDGTMSYTPVRQSYIGSAGAIVSLPSSQTVSFAQSVKGAGGNPQDFTVASSVVRQNVTDSDTLITYNALPDTYGVVVSPNSLSFCNGDANACPKTQMWQITVTIPANAVPVGGSTLRYAVIVKAVPSHKDHSAGDGTTILLEIKAPTPTDTTAPTTSVTSGTYVNNSLTNQNVTVNLSASDNAGGVGVQNLTYTITNPNGTSTTIPVSSSPFTASILVSAEGNTTIQYFAKDLANNTETLKTFYVNIDNTAPVLSLPADITTPATAANGAVVNYVATATDVSPANPTVNCVPASGSTFAIAETTVNCSATDAAGNTANGSFKVTVTRINQTITFAELGNKVYGDADFAVLATASSNLTVSFAAVGYCTVTGSTVRITGVGDCTITASQAGDATYNAAAPVSRTFRVNQKTLTPNITAASRVYDGTTAATIQTRTLTGGIVSGDIVTLTGGTATFDNKNVGNGKTVTATGLSLTGTAAGNYVLSSTSATTTANITALAITGSITANNKTYDGTTAATILTRTLAGVFSGDTVSYVGGTATFVDENVGSGKTVNATGLSLAGGDAGNYTVNATASTTADISALAITGSITAASKTYDGNANATILTRTLTGVISGDTVSYTGGVATFDNKNVGTGKTVTATGLSLSGADAGNYSANATATATADITAKSLTAVVTVDSKVYDATTAATILTRTFAAGGVISGDAVTLTGGTAAFADKNVGTNKPVDISGLTLTGADAGNYSITGTATATADITPKTLTATATGVDKEYDANRTATVTLSGNQISDDAVTLGYTAASFADKNVGTNKTVSVSGISITTGGADGGNYTLGNTTTASTTANIFAKSLTVSATGQNKEYDGNANAAVTLTDNRITGDVLTASYTTASFATKDVGTAKPVSVSGISVSGTDAGNYTLGNTTAGTTADITPKALTVTATATSVAYPGSPQFGVIYSGFVTNENPSVLSGAVIYKVYTTTPESEVMTTPYSPGTYIIRASGQSSGNYAITYTQGTFSVSNAAPVITLVTGTAPVAINTESKITVNFTDAAVAGDQYTLTTTWTNGEDAEILKNVTSTTNHNGTGIQQITYVNTTLPVGVYTVTGTVTDKFGMTSIAFIHQYSVVYNPQGGFVTGGGWIMSGSGACQDTVICGATNPTGRANFGFNSKYQPGRSVPTGQTQFEFKQGNLKFHSTVYEWMVISGNRAQYRGEGTINGTGQYRFVLTSTDGKNGASDKFRIRIMRVGSGGGDGNVVYDNQHGADVESMDAGTDISGGNIMIHNN